MGKLEDGFPHPVHTVLVLMGGVARCVALGQAVLQALGPDEGKVEDLETGRIFQSTVIYGEPEGTSERAHWCRGDCFRDSHLWMWNLKEKVGFEGLALMQGKSYKLFLKFQLGIKHQTVLQNQQSEIWWFCEWLYADLFYSPVALFKQLQ